LPWHFAAENAENGESINLFTLLGISCYTYLIWPIDTSYFYQ